MTPSTPRILIVAGSDSGGGAGIQADIKTVSMLGGHAMTAITAITAQNTVGVQAVHPVPAEMVVAQMRSCIDDIGVDAVKIGMIGSARTAHAVADVLEELRDAQPAPLPGREGLGVGCERSERCPAVAFGAGAPIPTPGPSLPGRGVPLVFDPVMVATSGASLADADTIAAFDRLLALATVATPNTPELAMLSGCQVADEISQQIAVDTLMERTGCRAVLAKGGHLVWGGSTYGSTEGGEPCQYNNNTRVFDVLFGHDVAEIIWDYPRIDTLHTHGTGCTLASAIAARLGSGAILSDATGQAIRFVRASLLAAPGLGHGHGPMGQQFARRFACRA